MYNGFHPESNVDRFYLSRSEGGRGLIGVHNIVETTILVKKLYEKQRGDIAGWDTRRWS